jgi:O-antigen/teichoic acid export membrane protein
MKLYKNALIYVLGNLATQSLPFLLLPVLTHFLTPEDYAIITTFNVVVGVLMIILGFNSAGLIGVEYYKCNKIQNNIYTSTYITLLIASSIIILIIINCAQYVLRLNLFVPFIWINIAVVVSSFNLIIGLKLLYLQFEMKAINYISIQFCVMLINTISTIVLITLYKMNYEGRLISILIGSIIMGIITSLSLSTNSYKFKFGKKEIKSLMAFGIPLIPHKASKWARGGMDKIFLLQLVGAQSTGVYSVGYTISLAMWVIVSSIDRAYTPYLFQKLNSLDRSEKIKIVKGTYIYFIMLLLTWILMNVFFNYALVYIVGKEYLLCKDYIIWISLGFLFHGMYLFLSNYIVYTKKTYLLTIISIFSTVIYLLLSYFLISKYNTIGAAIAAPISYFITFLLVLYFANKVYPMPWSLKNHKNDN